MPVEFSTLTPASTRGTWLDAAKARFSAFTGQVSSAIKSLGNRIADAVRPLHTRQAKVDPSPIKSAIQQLKNGPTANATGERSQPFDKLARALAHSVRHADKSDMQSGIADLPARLADLMKEPTLLTEEEAKLLKTPDAFMGKLVDAAVETAADEDKAYVKHALGLLRRGPTFSNAFKSAENSLGSLKQQLIGKHDTFEPKLLNENPTLANLPPSVTGSPAFKTLRTDMAHTLSSGSSTKEKQTALKNDLMPRLQKLLASEDILETKKLELTLSDGTAFMDSLGKEILASTPKASQAAVKSSLADLTQGGSWHELYHDATTNIGDVAEGFTSPDAANRKLHIGNETYSFVEQFGSGNFGQVQYFKNDTHPDKPGLVVKVPSGDTYAAKVDGPGKEGRALAKAVGTGASAENIVPLKTAIRAPNGELLLVLPFAEHGSFLEVKSKIDAAVRDKVIDEATAAQLKLTALVDLAKGMERLQLATGQLHLDIATRNLLIDSQGNALLADFGLSESVEGKNASEATLPPAKKGTPMPTRWTAPERLTKQAATPAADTWMFGMTLWEVVFGNSPLSRMTPDEINAMHAEGTFDPTLDLPAINTDEWPDGMHAQLRDLLQQVLQPDPSKRPTMDEVLKHPALTSGIVGSPAAKQILADLLSGNLQAPAEDNEPDNYNIDVDGADAVPSVGTGPVTDDNAPGGALPADNLPEDTAPAVQSNEEKIDFYQN